MKKILSLLLVSALVLTMTACQKNTSAPRPAQTEMESLTDAPRFELTQTGIEFLENICYYLPDFQSSNDFTDEFWESFLFMTYTGSYGSEYEFVSVDREDLGFEEQVVKINREQARDYVKLALGVELPDYEPTFEDMPAGRTSFYYKDGYYYIGLSDFGDVWYQLRHDTVSESGQITVEYSVSFGDEENAGTVTFSLAPAENANGFIVLDKTTVFE